MNRFLRSERPRASDYTGLALFFAAYLAVIGIILAPDGLLATKGFPGVAAQPSQ